METNKQIMILDAVTFAEAVSDVSKYCSTDPVRMNMLQGIRFEAVVDGDRSRLRLVGCGPHRLNVNERLRLPEYVARQFRELWPNGISVYPKHVTVNAAGRIEQARGRDAMTLTRKLTAIKREKPDLIMELSGDNLRIAIGSNEFLFPAEESRFVDWKTVIPHPETCDVGLSGPVGEFAECTKAVGSILDKDSPQMRVEWTGSELWMSSHASPKGVAETDVLIDCGVGDPIRFGINYRYLQQACRSFAQKGKRKHDARMRIELTGPTDAILITSDELPDVTIVVMPMRLEHPAESEPVAA